MTAARTGTDRPVPSGEPEPRAAAPHEHTWALMRFELDGDRPVVRQTCEACGQVRSYRAWERSWTPGEPEIRR